MLARSSRSGGAVVDAIENMSIGKDLIKRSPYYAASAFRFNVTSAGVLRAKGLSLDMNVQLH